MSSIAGHTWDIFRRRRYAQRTGDHVAPRLLAYVAAYTLFRAAFCLVGAEATSDPVERNRLLAGFRSYDGALSLTAAEAAAAGY